MRINKKVVESNAGRDKLFGRDYYNNEYFFNVGNVFEFLVSIFGAFSLFAFVVLMALGLYTFATPSKYEVALYNKRCDVIAGKNTHYVSRATSYRKNNYVCAIGPDWKTVDM